MLETNNYQVKNGDTLIGIAQRFGLPSWKLIYDSPLNKDLRALRSNPDNIQIGDRLIIPANPIIQLEKRIDTLNRLRSDLVIMYQNLNYEQNLSFRKAKNTASNVDIAATLLLLGVGLGKTVKSGFDAMKLTGKELAQANVKLARSVTLAGPRFAVEQGVQASNILEVTGEEGLATAIPKILIKSWFDMTTPSYWAQRFLGVNIDQLHNETMRNLNEQHQVALGSIDEKIKETRDQIIGLRMMRD